MRFHWTLILMFLLTAAGQQPLSADEQQKSGDGNVKLHPSVHRNHVRRASAEFLGAYRRITWYYDFATAAKLARETGRPMFVLFCRAGTIDDPITGAAKCAS